jgi:hypothetical protein
MAKDGKFSLAVKRAVAGRAGYRCSNPDCRTHTMLPKQSPQGSLSIGEAAHISGEKPGSARYDPDWTDDARSAEDNCIWLCVTCHTKVDRDVDAHPVGRLREWRQRHEQWLLQTPSVPTLPTLMLETSAGLLLPTQPGSVTPEDAEKFREHVFTATSTTDRKLVSLQIRVQFPEHIVRVELLAYSQRVEVRPETDDFIAVVSGEGSVTRQAPAPPPSKIVIHSDCFLPSRPISLRLRTQAKRIPRDSILLRGGDSWRHYMIATALYEEAGGYFPFSAVAEIREGPGRTFSLGPCEPYVDQPLVQTFELF